MQVVSRRKLWYTISLAAIAASIIIVLTMGVRLGIDFTGGSLLEVSYSGELPEPAKVNEVLAGEGITSVQIQSVDDRGYLIRMPDITEEQHRGIVQKLKEQVGDTSNVQLSQTTSEGTGDITIENIDLQFDGEEGETKNIVTEQRFESIGPLIGRELQAKSVEATLAVLITILLYVAWAFRKVSWPIPSWKYGVVALLTLFHDVVITFGIFTLLTHIFGWELNTAFVAAVLTIVGYSVNDTIVVFDRIRENVPRVSAPFTEIVDKSVNQTMSRSINTSLTTLLVLVAILIFGGLTIQSFVAALAIGIIVGTYSSIFVASPLLVSEYQRKQA